MSEYREKRVVVEEIPIGRRPVIEEQHDTIVHERSGISGAAIAAIVIAAIAAAVLITLMIVNSNQQGREDDLARQRDRAEADARAAQAANQQQPAAVPQPQSQPSTVVVPIPVPVPSASQPAPSTTEPPISDTSIEVDINSKLLDDGELRTHPLDVKVSGGTARLSGNLPNEDLKMRVEKIAKTVKGVRRVVNDITVSQ
jgi:Predicted periplasmic or secreted lipoprotein